MKPLRSWVSSSRQKSDTATGTTLPFCCFNPRLKALRITNFCSAVVQQVGEVANMGGETSPNDYNDIRAAFSRTEKRVDQVLGNWVSMLELEEVLPGPPPYRFNSDFPDDKRKFRAYVFLGMINMTDRIDDWSPEKLFALYETKVQAHSAIQLLPAKSPQTYCSVRQLAAITNRRLFITTSGDFRLCPKKTQMGIC